MNPTFFTKKAKCVAFLMMLFITAIANSQSITISGKVTDNNQKPLIGATVFIKSLNKGTATDFKGRFTLSIPRGNYIFKISYVGFQLEKRKVVVQANQKLIIQLKPQKNRLDDVLVAAVRVKADAPITYSNLTKKDLAKRNIGQDIPVLLNYLPSVVVSSDAGAGVGYTYMRVRGSDGSRINVTINGIPYNDAESQGTFWVNIGDFASSTQSLQLQRGVGTSTNGSGAFGASLNILTDAASEKANGEISNSSGSYGTRKHTIKFSTGKLNKGFELAGRLSKIYSDGYIDRAYSDLKSYFLQGSYVPNKKTLIKVLAFGGKEKTYQAWNGISPKQLKENRRQNPLTYKNETDNYWQDHYQLHWNQKIDAHWSTNIGLNYTKGKGYFEQYKKGKKIDLYSPVVVATAKAKDSKSKDITDLIVRRWLDNDFYVANLTTTYKNRKVEILSGLFYSNYLGDHFGEVIWARQFAPTAQMGDRYYFSDAKKQDFSFFSKATFNINKKLKAFFDLQGRFVNYKIAGITSKRKKLKVDKAYAFFNPKIGFTYKINPKNSGYISYARANREPNREDFKNGVNTYESLDDFELGWRLNTDVAKLNANIYYMDYRNQLVLTGAINDVGNLVRTSSGSSYRLGLELDAAIKISDKFSLNSNLTISKNRNRNFYATIDKKPVKLGDTPIAFSPSIIAGNTFTYQPIANLQIALLSKYVGKQYLSNLNSRVSKLDVLSSYFTSDFNITYEIKPHKIFKAIVLSGVVNNIFNKKYVDRGYYGVYDDDNKTYDYVGYYPQATANFLLGATLKF